MSSKRWVVVGALPLGVALSCATEERPDDAMSDAASHSGGSTATAGKSTSGSGVSEGGSVAAGGVGKAGTSTQGGVAQGGSAGKAGAAGAGGAAGGKGGTGGSAGTRGSAGSAGTSGSGGNAGTSAAGTSAGGTTSTGGTSGGLGCSVESAGGAEAVTGAGGAAGSALGLFADDFETGSAASWTTTLGTWAVVDDGSKVYEQSVQENKLQIAIANGVCAADQIIDARVKVVAFKGQSNSYVAALYGRVVDASTHYLLALGSDNKLILRKRVNSTSTGATAIGSAKALTVNVGQWYDVHFELVGTSLEGCVGDVCVSGTDASIASGSVGVGTVNTSARFDDVRVAAP